MTSEEQQALRRWHLSMMLSPQELKDQCPGMPPAPTSYKARLKRCDSVDGIVMTDGFRALWLSLPESVRENEKHPARNIECWAVIAAILANVGTESGDKLGVAAGKAAESGEKSTVSEVRFAQLQGAKTTDEFLRRLRRIIKQLKGKVNALKLANDIQRWCAEHDDVRPRPANQRISIKWAMDYYRAAPAKLTSD